MPGPLSITVIPVSSTTISTSGATFASSHASSALSTNSLRTTIGHCAMAWPVCAVSSFSEKKSSSRDVVNVVRPATRGGSVSRFAWAGVKLCLSGSVVAAGLSVEGWSFRASPSPPASAGLNGGVRCHPFDQFVEV